MMKRLTFLATLAIAALAAADARAQGVATGFSTFNQSSLGTPFSYTRTSNGGGPLPATITVAPATLGNFDITNPSFLASGGTTYTDAILTLDATSNDMATSMVLAPGVNIASQTGFSGNFTIKTAGGLNLLSGTFTGGVLLQTFNNVASIAFGNGNVEFTSDIFLPLDDEGFTLGLSGPFGALVANNGAFQNFSSNVSGNFSAAVIPEPATLAMAGLGVLVLPVALRVARRRRSGPTA